MPKLTLTEFKKGIVAELSSRLKELEPHLDNEDLDQNTFTEIESQAQTYEEVIHLIKTFKGKQYD